MKDWHKLKPELFKKKPYYLPGCDASIHGDDRHQAAAWSCLIPSLNSTPWMTSGMRG